MTRRDIFIFLAFAVAFAVAAHIGAGESERAHRALDRQYQQCVDRHGFGTPAFRACIR